MESIGIIVGIGALCVLCFVVILKLGLPFIGWLLDALYRWVIRTWGWRRDPRPVDWDKRGPPM